MKMVRELKITHNTIQKIEKGSPIIIGSIRLAKGTPTRNARTGMNAIK
jgi:hypothetical protein